MKPLWLKLVPLLVALLFTAGCNSSTRLGDVTVTLIDIRPPGTTAPERQAELTLRYINGNVFAIAVATQTHELYLNGYYAGKVKSSDPIGLPQVGANTQKVTLLLKNAALLQKLRAAPSKIVSYRLDSVLSLEVSDDWKTIKNSSTGEIDLSALLGAGRS